MCQIRSLSLGLRLEMTTFEFRNDWVCMREGVCELVTRFWQGHKDDFVLT